MQLILTQTDIETALIRYANDLITVKDGMTITVELKATRGADGATAIIDISPATAASETSTPNTSVAAVITKATAKAEPVKAKAAVANTAKPEVAAEANAVEEAADLQVTQVDNDPEVEEPEPEVEQEEEAQAEEAAPASKPASLFAGLRKPKND